MANAFLTTYSTVMISVVARRVFRKADSGSSSKRNHRSPKGFAWLSGSEFPRNLVYKPITQDNVLPRISVSIHIHRILPHNSIMFLKFITVTFCLLVPFVAAKADIAANPGQIRKEYLLFVTSILKLYYSRRVQWIKPLWRWALLQVGSVRRQ